LANHVIYLRKTTSANGNARWYQTKCAVTKIVRLLFRTKTPYVTRYYTHWIRKAQLNTSMTRPISCWGPLFSTIVAMNVRTAVGVDHWHSTTNERVCLQTAMVFLTNAHVPLSTRDYSAYTSTIPSADLGFARRAFLRITFFFCGLLLLLLFVIVFFCSTTFSFWKKHILMVLRYTYIYLYFRPLRILIHLLC